MGSWKWVLHLLSNTAPHNRFPHRSSEQNRNPHCETWRQREAGFLWGRSQQSRYTQQVSSTTESTARSRSPVKAGFDWGPSSRLASAPVPSKPAMRALLSLLLSLALLHLGGAQVRIWFPIPENQSPMSSSSPSSSSLSSLSSSLQKPIKDGPRGNGTAFKKCGGTFFGGSER